MGWAAELQLTFEQDGEVTRLRRRGGKGPLYVQKPFYPEGGVCHVYVLHPPGGVAGGDTLTFGANVEAGSRVLFTTPAATKFMRSGGAQAAQTQQLTAGQAACLEWLPQETIVFDSARARNKTQVKLESDSVFIGIDVVSLGRPANAERFDKGSYTGVLEIERYCPNEERYKTEFLDRQHYAGGDVALERGWGLAGHQVLGSLVATPADADCLEKVRSTKQSKSGEVHATLLNNVLIVRTLCASTDVAQNRLRRIWRVLRPLMLQREAEPPAIWRT